MLAILQQVLGRGRRDGSPNFSDFKSVGTLNRWSSRSDNDPPHVLDIPSLAPAFSSPLNSKSCIPANGWVSLGASNVHYVRHRSGSPVVQRPTATEPLGSAQSYPASNSCLPTFPSISQSDQPPEVTRASERPYPPPPSVTRDGRGLYDPSRLAPAYTLQFNRPAVPSIARQVLDMPGVRKTGSCGRQLSLYPERSRFPTTPHSDAWL